MSRKQHGVKRVSMKNKKETPYTSPLNLVPLLVPNPETISLSLSRTYEEMLGQDILYGAILELYEIDVESGTQKFFSHSALFVGFCRKYFTKTMRRNIRDIMGDFRHRNPKSMIRTNFVNILFLIKRKKEMMKPFYREIWTREDKMASEYQYSELHQHPAKLREAMQRFIHFCQMNKCEYWINENFVDPTQQR